MSYINRAGKIIDWKNLASDIIIHGKIETTAPRASRLTKLIAKLINWGKINDLHSKRLALRYLVSRKKTILFSGKERNIVNILDKLALLGEKYRERQGGYTRTIKLANKIGDGTLKVQISLL